MASFSLDRLNPRRWLTWGLVLGAGVLLAWIPLSFLVRFPVDEAKVHPEIRTAMSGTGTVFLRHQEFNKVVTIYDPGRTAYLHLPEAGDDSRIITHKVEDQISVVAVDEFPHTRRYLVQAFEEGKASFLLEDKCYHLSRDPFFLTRQLFWIAYRKVAEMITGAPRYP